MLRRFGVAHYSALLVFLSFMALSLWLKISWYYDCVNKQNTDQNNPHRLIQDMFPVQRPEDKADISIGILCQPDEWFVDDVIESLSSITSQVVDHEEIKSYIVYVGIWSFLEAEVAFVKQKINKAAKLKRVTITYIAPSEKYFRYRMNLPDVDPAYNVNHKTLVERRASQNMVFAQMFWYASQQSKYFLITDSLLTLDERGMFMFMKELKPHRLNPQFHMLRDEKASEIFGAIYAAGEHLAECARFVYWMSPYQDIQELLHYFSFFSLSYVRAKTSKPLFIKRVMEVPVKIMEKNPLALVTTNMTVTQEFFPTNPYERGELFWTSTATRGSFIIVKFLKEVCIKHIRIDTGINIYFRDTITRAILEEAPKFVGGRENCGEFKRIDDFRGSFVDLDLSHRNSKTACLRIRLLMDENHWAGIRLIQVTT